MRETQGVEIGFVDWINRVTQRLRHKSRPGRHVPCHHDQERKDEPCSCDDRDRAGQCCSPDCGTATKATPDAEDEQELPGERIEIPCAAWKRRQVPIEMSSCEVENGR